MGPHFRELMSDEINAAFQDGIREGELQTKRTTAKNLWDNEVAVDTIAKSLSVSEAQVEEWIKKELN
jgi:predicted transposase/invertase (TIGR01784 family)